MSNEDKALLEYFLDVMYELVDGEGVQDHRDIHKALILRELFERFTEDEIVLFTYKSYGVYNASTILLEVQRYVRQLNNMKGGK